MTNELPAIKSTTEVRFTRLGEYEELDMEINFKKGEMTFERVIWDEDESGKEVFLADIIDQLKEYNFLGIVDRGLNIRQLQTMFAFKMKL